MRYLILVLVFAACDSAPATAPPPVVVRPAAPAPARVEPKPQHVVAPDPEPYQAPVRAARAKNCRKGCPCGNSCISCAKTCRK